jgi:hypothetical protein
MLERLVRSDVNYRGDRRWLGGHACHSGWGRGGGGALS